MSVFLLVRDHRISRTQVCFVVWEGGFGFVVLCSWAVLENWGDKTGSEGALGTFYHCQSQLLPSLAPNLSYLFRATQILQALLRH